MGSTPLLTFLTTNYKHLAFPTKKMSLVNELILLTYSVFRNATWSSVQACSPVKRKWKGFFFQKGGGIFHQANLLHHWHEQVHHPVPNVYSLGHLAPKQVKDCMKLKWNIISWKIKIVRNSLLTTDSTTSIPVSLAGEACRTI